MISDTLTFDAWKLFHQAYPHRVELNHHFRVTESDGASTQLQSVMKNLSTLPEHVLTLLCSDGIDLGLPQLMTLMNISSLAALMLAPRETTHTEIRNWCRAVSEKGALTRLKVILIRDCGERNRDILHNLATLPALTLVCIPAGQLANKKHLPRKGETCSAWCRLQDTDGQRYTDALNEPQDTLSMSLGRLHDYATNLSPSPGQEVVGGTRLSITYTSNVADFGYSWRNDPAWFVRDPASKGPPAPRSHDTGPVPDKSERATKKRKVRQGKQQDVGSLLGMFS